MKTFYVTMQHRITGARHLQPVLAKTQEEAIQKCNDYPYNTFFDFVVL